MNIDNDEFDNDEEVPKSISFFFLPSFVISVNYLFTFVSSDELEIIARRHQNINWTRVILLQVQSQTTAAILG